MRKSVGTRSGAKRFLVMEHKTKRILVGVVVCFCVALAGCSSSSTTASSGGGGDNAANADKIVGKWKMVKADGAELPKEAGEITMEFLKDGSCKFMSSMEKKADEANYKIDGDKITFTKPSDPKHKPAQGTIKSLTADTLIMIREPKEGQTKSVEIELKKQ